MNSMNRWVAGFAVRFGSPDLRGIWIIRRVYGENVTFANIDTQSIVVKSEQDLSERISKNEIQFLAEGRHNGDIVFQDLSENDQEETVRKYAYVKAYLESEDQKRSRKKLEVIVNKVANEIGDENKPAWNTVNTWIKQYFSAGLRLKGLYPNHFKKGNRAKKLDLRVYEIIDKVLPRYFKGNRPLASSIYKQIEGKILKYNLNNPEEILEIPAYSTIAYHIKRRTYQENIRGRVGKNRARYEFSSVGEAPKTTRILERVEADHTPLDIHVLSDDTNTLLGRPTLTVLVDHYSGMVVGCQISFEEPSYASASLAISCAILPKNEILEFYGIDGCWPAHGVMEMMLADNGSEFWSDNLEMAISEVGSLLQFAPVRTPNYKGTVERFFRSLRTMLIDSLPGKTNGIKDSYDEYSAESEAKLTLNQFKKIFYNWLVNIYHRQPIGDAVKSPLDLWNESARDFPVDEQDRKHIETALMASDTRTIQRSGIQIENLKYNNDSLRDIYRREGPTSALIKYSPFDLGHIYVFDELNGIYIPVRCDEYEYAKGLSMYAHKIIQSHANKQRKSYRDDANLKKAKAEIFGSIDDIHKRNAGRKTQVTAKKAARIQQVGIVDQFVELEKPIPAIISNIFAEEQTEDWEIW